MIKKADIILLILIIACGLIISFGPLKKAQGGTEVRISVDGELYGIYDLYEDQTIDINHNGHSNVIIIEDGKVRMGSSTCHNQICVKKGTITLSGDSIVCLPNKVTVEITGKGGDVDVISG